MDFFLGLSPTGTDPKSYSAVWTYKDLMGSVCQAYWAGNGPMSYTKHYDRAVAVVVEKRNFYKNPTKMMPVQEKLPFVCAHHEPCLDGEYIVNAYLLV